MSRRTIDGKDELITKAVKLYEKGTSTGAIAEEFGVSQATVYNWLRGKVEFRPRGRPALA